MLSLPADLHNRSGKPSPPVALTPSRRLSLSDPSGYRPDEELVDAIRVALLLRKPLLVTGEPGTGKTELGRYLAWKSNFRPFKFDAKSTSVSRDLYYYYDALGRFQAKQSGEAAEARSFFRLEALGEAIVRSMPWDKLPDKVRDLLPEKDYAHEKPGQSVVVIDEIDKAPRDFPNDLLNEIDQKFFRIAELGIPRVEATREFEPVLVITSNSEKNLPAPFLRRCIYYHIEFPKKIDRLREIVAARIAEFQSPSPMLDSALELFDILRRDASGLSKKPATAELLDWILALLADEADPSVSLKEQPDLINPTLPALIKNAADRAAALELKDKWLGKTSAK